MYQNENEERNNAPNIQYNYDPYSGMRTDGGESGGGYTSTTGSGYPPQSPAAATTKKRMPEWAKVLIIIAAVVLFAVILTRSCSNAFKSAFGEFNQTVTEDYNYPGPYIGVLYLNGTIMSGSSGDGYNQDWMLARVDQMTLDEGNKGMLLYINTPGGSAYATAELYHALEAYKAQGKPIYVYMANQATSGGYYAAMPADKIYANEECWTGSIGVVISGLYDFSGLFEKYGVKAENIVSGRNKDMGTNIKALTDEQRQILQSLVDDSFDRFVAAVVKGRNLPESKVRELADGRIYTANQAKENGLIDEIGTLEGTIEALQKDFNLTEADIHHISYVEQETLRSLLGLDSLKKNLTDAGRSDLEILSEMLDKNGEFEIMCIAPKKAE